MGVRISVTPLDQRPAAAGTIGVRPAVLTATSGPAGGRLFIGAPRPPF